jgi:hypothetical protein
VIGKRPTEIGNLICVSGRVTRAKCGLTVKDASGERCYNGGCVTNLIVAWKYGEKVVRGGDSGGPMYTRPNSTDAMIRGMILAQKDNGIFVYGHKVSTIEAKLNVTVYTG